MGIDGCIHDGWLLIRDINSTFDLTFLCHLLGTPQMLDQYRSLAAGSTVNNLNKELVGNTVVTIPQIDEQRVLGQYLERLDNLITLHQRNSADFVSRFFSDFTNTWEQRELGSITSSYSGGTPTAGKAEYYDGDIPFIRSGEINEEKTELFLSELGYKNSSAAMVEKGDILYALYGATSGEVSISKLKGAINQAILAIKPNEGYDSEFLMQWLRNQKDNIISTYLQGGQGNLSGTIVKSLKVDITTYDEQQAIGAYFRNLDNLITLHQCEYIFKKYKKRCDCTSTTQLILLNHQGDRSNDLFHRRFFSVRGYLFPK